MTQAESQLHALLSPLASALAERPMDVLPTRGAEPSWSDRAHIFVTPALDQAARREACAAQALLIAQGSLEPRSLRGLLGRPGLARRYMALELSRALQSRGTRLPHRIERAFRGYCDAPATDSAAASLRRARDESHVVRDLPPHLGVLRPARVAWTRSESARASSSRHPTQDQFRDAALPEHDEDDEVEASGNDWLRLLSTPLGGGAVSDFFLRLFGFGRSPGKNDEATEDGGGSVAMGHAALLAEAAPAGSRQLAALATPSGLTPKTDARFAYPEWQASRARYLHEHVHVHEVLPAEMPGDPARAQLESAHISRRAVRAQLARVGVELAKHRAQLDGHELDLDRVVQHAVERRAGHSSASERTYIASRRTRRDLSLLTLLDISQSTADRTPEGHSVFGQSRELAREITSACDRLGDRTALYAFHSWGRHQVRMLRVKSLDERFGRRCQLRLDALEPAGLTRMGAAIRHATHLLAKDERHAHRVMLLLSDGFAYDDEYSQTHAEADTERALAGAAERGIACVCLRTWGRSKTTPCSSACTARRPIYAARTSTGPYPRCGA